MRPLAGRVGAALGWATDYLAERWEGLLQQGKATVQSFNNNTSDYEKRN